MEMPKCKTCPYWSDTGPCLEEDPESTHSGLCHRHPPLAHFGPRTKKGRDDHAACATADQWSQPWTYATMWCGEHPDFPAYIEARRRIGPDHPEDPS